MRSYAGNFLVAAPDATSAAEAARLAELTRKAVFDFLGHEREWSKAATIHLRFRNKNTPDGLMPLWTVSVFRGEFKRVREDVYPNKRNDVLVFQVVAACLDDIAGPVPPERKGSAAVALPLWLLCGVAENLSADNVAFLQPFVANVVSNGTFVPIGQLLLVKDLPSDEAQRELFFKESGSVVDFLLHQRKGRSKLRRAITVFRAEGDFGASLLLAFAGDFGTLARLQERWKRFAVAWRERTIGALKMSLSETKEALDRVLTVNIPVVDRDTLEESVITTDLKGLFYHRNRRTVRRIAGEKLSELFQISLRASPEYSAILEEYLRALSAIGKNDRKAFKRHFGVAERLRRDLEKTALFEAEETEHANTANE